jgi:hypothetical protein
MAKPKNQRNRSSANTNSNNNQVNGHVDATVKTADVLPVDGSINKPTETGDSHKNSQKELDTQKIVTTSETALDSGDKTSENIAENSNINKECTGLYKNERLAQCLTSCIGAETRLTVVNGAEYTGFFHTFSENSELVVDTVHRTKVPYQERDISNKKSNTASNATSSETDKDSKKSASNQAGGASQQPVPLQLNSSRELPKSTEITDDLIFPPETFVMMEFDSLDFQECKMLLSQLTKQEKDQKLAENTAQTEADLSKILSAFSPTAKVPADNTASSPSAEVGLIQTESGAGLDPAILNSIKSTKSSKKI